MAGGTQRQTAAVGNGVLFEVIFKNADPRKQPSHGISLSYGGQVYSCNDAVSVRSVHTIHTDDEDDDDSRKSCCQSKAHGRVSLQEISSSSACLKKNPRKSALQPTSLLKPSPKKLKRSRTLPPSHQSRARSILAPFSKLSQKLSGRRHSYHESTKTKGDKSQARQEKTEKTKPLLHERPIMQSFHHAFQQAPPQSTYQNPFPMYRYVPVPQPQPMFGAVPMAFPVAQGAANTAPQSPLGLQHLQEHINHLTTILAANPIDLHAKRELDRLLADRNAFLDSATRRPAPTTTLGHIEASNSKPADLRSIAEKALTADSVPSNESQKKAAASIASSDERGALNLHICSGCGETRSPSFHRKHPFAKPVHNVCRKCRESRRSSSIMSRYHFCSSCGIVRSKDYHRRRGGETAVSTRSKICRKCHANGDSVYRSTNEACREDEAPTKDRRHKSVDPKAVPRNTPQKGSVRVEPRVRPIHSRRHGGSPDDAETCGYDGVSDLTSATFKTQRTRTERPSVKQEVFTTYRSPEISENASSNQPASMESISQSMGPEYPISMEGTAAVARSQISAYGSASEESLHASQQDATPINPYYQPRNTTKRLSSPFHYEETLYRRSSPDSECAPSQDSFRVSDQHSGPCSPEGPHGPRFVDRNQSWPGDLNLPSPGGAFSQFSHTARKASASEGAPSPITRDYLLPDDFDRSERFTKGAFGKIPFFSSAFRPSSNSPPSSPWASFSGPIPNPSSEPAGSRGAFSNASRKSAFGRRYDTSPEPTSPADSPGFPFRFGCQPTSYAGRDDERATRGGFASTRGAWNTNTAGTSSCAPRHGGNDYVPEPIIEEPSSPLLKSPLTTPLLLEFNLADAMSDSGVELLTDPSSSSASTSSSASPEDEDLLASRFDSLTVDNH